MSRFDTHFSILKTKFNIFTVCCAFSLVLACQPVSDSAATSAETPADQNTYFPIAVGGQPLTLQLALTPAEQQRGLMFRESLPEGHGMLFLFERPERRGFWMRNTSIPLDIGYFDAEGQLREIHKLYPYDENTVASASDQILIAVETNRGWFQTHHVRPGATIDLDALRTAIKRRGLPARLLNLPED